MAKYITEDVASYGEAEPSGKFILGDEYTDSSRRIFRWLKLVDAVIATDGFVAEWASTTKNHVTVDRSGGSSLGRIPAGVAMGTVTPARPYAFWLVRGRHPRVQKGVVGTINAGVKIKTHSTEDGCIRGATAYTEVFLGVTPETNISTRGSTIVDVCIR